jgi:hypothetical protein
VYESVRRGEIDERSGRKVLDDIRGLRIRLLGDRVLQDHAWRIAPADRSHPCDQCATTPPGHVSVVAPLPIWRNMLGSNMAGYRETSYYVALQCVSMPSRLSVPGSVGSFQVIVTTYGMSPRIRK